MDLEKQLMEDMKSAMKSGEKIRLETIRGLRSQIKNTEIEKRRKLTEDELIQVLTSAAKKRKESIEQFQAVNRHDRAAEEELELRIVESYLPEQMSESEIAKLVDDTIKEVNASSIKEIGKVMGAIMPKVKGKADGKLVQNIVREKLSAS